MQESNDSTRVLRIAAWIWLGFLIAMAAMDFILYLPQVQQVIAESTRLEQVFQNPLPLPPGQNPQAPQQRNSLAPVILFYMANGVVALFFLAFAHLEAVKERLGDAFYPLMLFVISTTPILINVLIVPRFPQGPLSNAEGMALRQVPVLLVALVLVAWKYHHLAYVIFFSFATTTLELGLIALDVRVFRSVAVFVFVAIIRTISFIAVGIFISVLVTRLREQQESLRAANANITHYASTLEQLAVSRERNRLARELHDTLAHSLTALSVSLETAKAYFDVDLKETRELLDKSLDITRKGVDETRRALRALRSSDLEDLGLRLAIKKTAESAASRLGLELGLDLQDPMPSLSPDVEQAIYRVAQESIENVAKHSRAKKFSIHLSHNGRATLVVQDDGMGFDMRSKEPTGHFGLVGMRERAELAGGKLKIESEKGKGTKVVLTI